MSFDNSRYIFNPWNDYLGVVMEQGRVQLDSDWNEWLAELSRRIQAGTLDTLGSSMGRAVYPSTTPNAFRITASAGALSIGAGRIYVDGILAENHGPVASAVWDPALDELSGAPQIDGAAAVTVDYTAQPYLPGATLPAGNGPFLAYVDVWRRPITWLEDTTLMDKAVAVDTSARLQTVWQVKLLDVSSVSGGVTCSTPDSSISAWQQIIAPSAGQLTTGVAGTTSSGPCCLNASSGYTGMENQFYRVEIHQGTQSGGGQATFKWSRDNGSVQTGVTAITQVTNTAGNTASQLTVMSMGRDQILGFTKGNWIEITDDNLELNGLPGELHLIDSIDFAHKTITLDALVSATSFPLTSGQTNPNRHTRITRWDQAGKVFESDNTTVYWDLGAAGAKGDIPVPAAGTTLILENGVTVSFGLNPSGGTFHIGDFWTFAARTADGSVETLTNAYPRGIHHHYARLSVVTFPSTAPDCRVPWPPPAGAGTECCCSITIQPTDITGNTTLQSVIDKYQGLTTATEICLAPGVYTLTAPLRFTTAHSNIGLKACQDGTVTIQVQKGLEKNFIDGVVIFDNTNSVSLKGLYFAVPMAAFSAGGSFAGVSVSSLAPDVQTMLKNLVVSIGVRCVNSMGMTVENCEFGFADFEEDLPNANAQAFGVGIFGTGQCSNWEVTGTTFAGEGSFLAGILVAPQAAFTPPKRRTNIPLEDVPLQQAIPGQTVFKDEVLLKDEAAPASSGKAALNVDNPIAEQSGVLGNLGNLGNIFKEPAVTNLAADGGKVLASSLDYSTFKGNTFSGLTIAALLLGENGEIEFSENQVNCSAGCWLLSPLQAGSLVFDPNNIATAALAVAMGYPLPQNDTTSATDLIAVAAAPASVRIYAGAANFTDSQGNVWLPDTKASGVTVQSGVLYHAAPPPAITGAMPASTDQALYQSERRDPDFSYTFTGLPAGFYQMVLKFAEIYYTTAGKNQGVRVFNVAVNGTQVMTDFDIVADAGGADSADDYTFSNIIPNAQGSIVVEFTGTSTGSDGNAKIGAVELDPQWNGNEPLSQTGNAPTGLAETAVFFTQLVQLSQQGYVGTAASPSSFRIDRNEMQGLVSTGVMVLGDDQVLLAKTSSVMMSGNRLEGTIAASIQERVILADDGPVQASFYCVGAIASVTRCVVSGNMLINDAQAGGNAFAEGVGQRLSFILNDPSGSPLTPTSPAPELIISGNLFQGRVFIAPARFDAAEKVPSPMNSWNFLNTVLV